MRGSDDYSALRWLRAGNVVETGIACALLTAARLPKLDEPASSDPSPSELMELREAHRNDAFITSPVDFVESLMSSFQRQRLRLFQAMDGNISATSPKHPSCDTQPHQFLMSGKEFFFPPVFQSMAGEYVEDTPAEGLSAATSVVGVLRCGSAVPHSSSKTSIGTIMRDMGAQFSWPDADSMTEVAQERAVRQIDNRHKASDSDEEELGDAFEICMRSTLPTSYWGGGKRPREASPASDDARLAPVVIEVVVEGPRAKSTHKATPRLELEAGVLGIYEAHCDERGVPSSRDAVLKAEILVRHAEVVLKGGE